MQKITENTLSRQLKLAAVVYAVLSLGGWARGNDLERTLDAIAQAESNGRPNAVGDKGHAIGAYQIWRPYWKDGTQILGVSWPYSDAKNPGKARRVVRAYVQHYQKAGGYPATPETWARLHNGGPKGPDKKSTKTYWLRVKSHLTNPSN